MFDSLSLQLVILVLWTRIPFLGILSSKGSFQDSFSKRSSRSFPVAFWLWSWSVPSCWSYQFLPYTSQPINQSYNQTFLSTKRWEFISTIDLSHICCFLFLVRSDLTNDLLVTRLVLRFVSHW